MDNSKHCMVPDGDSIDEYYLHVFLNRDCSCESIASKYSNNYTFFNCNEKFPVDHTFFAQFAYCFMFGLLVLCSLGGNLTVVWIILKHERMRTKTNLYLLNLAFSDISITVLNTTFSSIYNLYYNWIFPVWYCSFNNVMAITPICASVFTMIVMSIDRYIAIVYPLKRRPGRNATITIIFVIWILACICGFPAWAGTKVETYYFIDAYNKQIFKDQLCLADNFPDGNSKTSYLFCVYNHSLVVMQYVLPLLILSFTYGRVAYVLRQNNAIGDTRHMDSIKAKRKASNMLALVVISFIIMWLPYNLYFLFLINKLENKLDFNTTLYIYMNIYFLGMSSCVLNPVIYYFMNERFRLGFRYAFRWLPWVHVKKEEYQNLFMNTSRASHLTSRFSVANTIYSSQIHHKNSEEKHSPVPL